MPTYKTPDVYIEEFEPAAPITGVGTSTAAFLGPCLAGPLMTPFKLTSWDQFRNKFGKDPVPGMYLWYAVRGFFENGGAECYVTRVSQSDYGTMTLADMVASATIVVTARKAGVMNPGVEAISVDDSVQSVDPAIAKLYRPTGTISSAAQGSTDIQLSSAADAARFRPGDRISWDTVVAADDRATIANVSGSTLQILTPLSKTYAAGKTVRLANPIAGTDTVRVEEAPEVAPGMALLLKQGAKSETVTVKSVLPESLGGGITTWRVTFREGLVNGFNFGAAAAVTVASFEFKLTVEASGSSPAVYDDLGMDPEHPRYFAKIVNARDPYVTVAPVDPPNATAAPANRPKTLAATPLPNGIPDDPATLSATDYNDAIDLLEAIDDVNILAVPDRADLAVQDHLISHCANLMDRFAVLQTAPSLEPVNGPVNAMSHRSALTSPKGYAALYYPWIEVIDSKGKDTLMVPPVGHVVGIYARTDESRGVHKAPAGLGANVSGAVGVERLVTAREQGDLNLEGVNVLRVFGNGGPPTVWGARTLASGQNGDANWQYVNIRRLFLYLEESIQEGLRGAVFEPNNLQLWQKLKRTLTDFLTRSWREGALFGEKASDAFYVRIDQDINPFSEQQLGRLHIEIGVRPSYPAEFIIVRIGIWDGGSDVSES